MIWMRTICARGFCVLLGAFFVPVHAHAAVSGTATLTSDYRFRGVSLSAEKPAAEFSLDYDHPAGGYAGAVLSTVQFAEPARRTVGLFGYAGYVKRYGTFNLEGGGSYATFTGNHEYDYPEIFAGVTTQRSSARLYFSRHYFGQVNTQYLEFNTTRPLHDQWVIVGHVGLLHAPDGPGNRDRAYHYDVRVGLSLAIDNANVQLAWVTTHRVSSWYPVTAAQQRHALILSLTRSF